MALLSQGVPGASLEAPGAYLEAPGASLDAPDRAPSPEEVERKIDELYRRGDGHGTAGNGNQSGGAGSGREESRHRGGGRRGAEDERGGGTRGEAETARDGAAGAGERGARQRGRGAAIRDGAAQRTDMLARAREMLSAFTATPHRPAPSAPDAAALLLADAPHGYFEPAQLMSRLTARQKVRAGERTAQRPPAAGQNPSDAVPGQRAQAGPSAAPRYDIRAAKATVQRKLATARALVEAADTPIAPTATTPTAAPVTTATAMPAIAPVTATAAIPAAVVTPETAVPAEAPAMPVDAPSPLSAAAGEGARRDGSPSGAEAHKALAFARAQIGKPYVWGAAGPGSYDCSGLTRAAWKAAGVALPRSLRDQSDAGTTIPPAEALPGDLVFFRDADDFHGEVGHVGVYAGHGLMIHAPEPGAYVREDPVLRTGAPAVHHVVRPA